MFGRKPQVKNLSKTLVITLTLRGVLIRLVKVVCSKDVCVGGT